MANLAKAYLDLFIAISLLIAFGQDIYHLSSSSSPSVPLVSDATSNSSMKDAHIGPELKGVVIRVTDGLKKPVQDLLVTQKYNVKVEAYKFEGADWWFETALSYGHIILVYMLMSKYKTENNDQTKKKIMWGGAMAVMAWFFLAPMLKQNKVAIELHGRPVYNHNQIVPADIISTIADEVDMAEFTEEIQQF